MLNTDSTSSSAKYVYGHSRSMIFSAAAKFNRICFSKTAARYDRSQRGKVIKG
jgi:hypothetical protein